MPFIIKIPLSDVAPVTQAEGDVASPGTGTQASRYDHRHGMPSTYTPSTHESTHPRGGSDPIDSELDLLTIPAYLPVELDFSVTADAGTHGTLGGLSVECGVDGVVGAVTAYALSTETFLNKNLEFKGYIDHDPGEVYDDRWYHQIGFGDAAYNNVCFFVVSADRNRCDTVSAGSYTSTYISGLLNNSKASYKIVWSAAEVKFYKNGVLQATHTTNIPTVAIPVSVRCTNLDTATAVTSWTRGWCFVIS